MPFEAFVNKLLQNTCLYSISGTATYQLSIIYQSSSLAGHRVRGKLNSRSLVFVPLIVQQAINSKHDIIMIVRLRLTGL